MTFETAPVTLTTSNDVSEPNWHSRIQSLARVEIQLTNTQNYKLWFLTSAYPKSYDPVSSALASSRSGTAAGGAIWESGTPSSFSLVDASTCPLVFPITELTAGASVPSRATVNHAMLNDPAFPDLGRWAAAYEDSSVDYGPNPTSGITDFSVSDAMDICLRYWVHDDMLGGQMDPLLGGVPHNNWDMLGWAWAGELASAGLDPTYRAAPAAGVLPDVSLTPQTWPIRDAESSLNPNGYYNDCVLFGNTLLDPAVRNFFGQCHGDAANFGGLIGGPLPQRYRFVYLEGCQSYSAANFAMFGAEGWEVPAQSYLDDSNNGPCGNNEETELTCYADSGLRPAAFVGNLLNVRWAYDIPLSEGTSGMPGLDVWFDTQHRVALTPRRNVEARGNWEIQFFALWAGAPGVTPVGLLEAKRQADWLAWTGPLIIGWDGLAPSPPALDQLKVGEDASGNEVYYSPVNSIKIAGYMFLGFNGWNHASDDLPQSAP